MSDRQAVHDRLKAILAPYRSSLVVSADGPGGMILELPEHKGKPWGYVAGTRVGKRYVSYYLMGVYAGGGTVDDISPELLRRMQGKSCFNFTAIDEALFAELAALTQKSIARQPALVEGMLASRARKG